MSETSDQRSGYRVWGNLLIVLISFHCIAFSVYGPSLRYEMIFDDYPSIEKNRSVHSLTPLFGSKTRGGPLFPDQGNPFSARPLVNLSIAVNYHFSGIDPYWYRVCNVMIHVWSAVLIWLIVRETLRLPFFGSRMGSTGGWVSYFGALIWMLHPVHNETVIYLTQRTELMMGMFYFLTLYCSIQYWHSVGKLKRSLWVVAAAGSCVSGMLCKEMIASVPAMVLVYDWMFVSTNTRDMLRRSWPLYVALSINWIVAIAIYRYGNGTPLAGFNNTISAVDWWFTESNAFFVYWKLTLWPYPLLAHYHVPTLTEFRDAWPGVLGMVFYVALMVWLIIRRNSLGYALLWFLAVLSPTLVVPLPREEIAERRLYAAIAPLIPIATYFLFHCAHWLVERLQRSPKRVVSQAAGVGLGVMVAVALALVSVRTMPRLRSDDALWSHVLGLQPDNPLALTHQAAEKFKNGEHVEAETMLERSYEIDSAYMNTILAYANVKKKTGHVDEAIRILRRGLEDHPHSAGIRYDLACALEEQYEIDSAIQLYEQALELSPSHHAAHTNLGLIKLDRGDVPGAIVHLESAAKFEPDIQNCMNLMNVYLQTGKFEKARHAAQKLLVAAKKEGRQDIVERVERGLQALETMSR